MSLYAISVVGYANRYRRCAGIAATRVSDGNYPNRSYRDKISTIPSVITLGWINKQQTLILPLGNFYPRTRERTGYSNIAKQIVGNVKILNTPVILCSNDVVVIVDVVGIEVVDVVAERNCRITGGIDRVPVVCNLEVGIPDRHGIL